MGSEGDPGSPPASPSSGHSSWETASTEQTDRSLAPSSPAPPSERSQGSEAGRPKRCKITREQLAVLVESFEEEPLPNFDQRQALASALGMTPRSVQIWFQNRRQRLKPAQPKVSASQQTALPADGSYQTAGYSQRLPQMHGRPYAPGLAAHPPAMYGAPPGFQPTDLLMVSRQLGKFPMGVDALEPFAATKALLSAGYQPPAALALAARRAGAAIATPPSAAASSPGLAPIALPPCAAAAGGAATGSGQADGLLMLLACADGQSTPVST